MGVFDNMRAQYEAIKAAEAAKAAKVETEKTAAQKLGEQIDAANYPIYAGSVGDTPYAFHFTANGKDYAYLPKDTVQNSGFQSGSNAYIFPWFANQDNLSTLSKNASSVDFSGTGLADALKRNGLGLSGYLFDYSAVPFDGELRYVQNRTLNGLKLSLIHI